MQQLGPDVESGVILEWLVAVGDTVAVGDPLVEVETDKITVEMPALDGGVLVEITCEPGDTVAVGAVIAYLES
jgi:pyruvate/2-oxoglutarate dehydrogenase complex dihydrolipoamide acyltransferase (E2) component